MANNDKPTAWGSITAGSRDIMDGKTRKLEVSSKTTCVLSAVLYRIFSEIYQLFTIQDVDVETPRAGFPQPTARGAG